MGYGQGLLATIETHTSPLQDGFLVGKVPLLDRLLPTWGSTCWHEGPSVGEGGQQTFDVLRRKP